MAKKSLIVFTGAGISAESGIKTFRDSGGLWEEFRIEDVATLEAWENNRELVLGFYNQRRKQLLEANPNAAHHFVAELQTKFDVQVITQNVDDLHERAGSKKVMHLHGELMKARSTVDPTLTYQLKKAELLVGDNCIKGSQLRPDIVWFGEDVPNMEKANGLAEKADLFVVIGTSLNVYPAAGIINFVKETAPKWLIDPNDFNLDYIKQLKHIKQTAVNGVNLLREELFRNL
ncbi:MAG: NAD-dependent deacylase [Bacteroidota bacterium]|nr:NAD-dependent deacylase [Bacteroidota bacterium]MDP3144063.1 NAD-dependent deacylase [Bacteroidota bacterium]